MSPARSFSREVQSGEAAEAQGNTVRYTHRTGGLGAQPPCRARGSPGRPGQEAGGRTQHQSRAFVGFPRERPGRAGIPAQHWLAWVAPAWLALAHSRPQLPSAKPGNDSSTGLRLCGVHGPEGGGMARDGLVCISKVRSHGGPLLSLKLAGPQRGSLSYAKKDF